MFQLSKHCKHVRCDKSLQQLSVYRLHTCLVGPPAKKGASPIECVFDCTAFKDLQVKVGPPSLFDSLCGNPPFLNIPTVFWRLCFRQIFWKLMLLFQSFSLFGVQNKKGFSRFEKCLQGSTGAAKISLKEKSGMTCAMLGKQPQATPHSSSMKGMLLRLELWLCLRFFALEKEICNRARQKPYTAPRLSKHIKFFHYFPINM